MRRPVTAGAVLVALVLVTSSCKPKDNGATPVASSSAAQVVSAAPDASAAPMAASKVEAQKKWLSAYSAAFNKHDAEALSKLYAADAIYAELSSAGGESKGTEAIKKDYATELDGFSDVKLAITRSWHIGDVVAVEYIQSGTGTANDDSERKFGFTGAHLLWFDKAGERVVRDQIYFDDVTMRVQLGWADPPLSKLKVRAVREVPPQAATWDARWR